MKRLITPLLILCFFSVNTLAYGPHGHRLVGAVADKRLAKNKAVANKVKKLLDGLTLEQVSTLPDEIKSWDDCGGRAPSPKPVTTKSRINDELRAFVNANKCSSHPSHHEFHYTDVPVSGGEKYADGKIGRGEFDVVQMIPFCIKVLRGETPEDNERAITKSVAVILLTHYLGDIHQPLHVGAEFFDAAGKPVEPTDTNPGFGDQGGNKLTLFTFVNGKLKSVGKLHGYWDSQTVDNAFGKVANAKVALQLTQKAPAKWKLTGDPETWAEQMANDILPAALQAHQRLEFRSINIPASGTDIESGQAREKKKTGGASYSGWAAGVVRKEIQIGGWRLAALLEEVLQ
jgi:hypothetical protein